MRAPGSAAGAPRPRSEGGGRAPVIAVWALVALSAGTAAVGSLGGIGGAVLLVPVLVLLGVDPVDAAPLGVLTVAAGSLAAAPRQLEEGLVHHRLGITLEIAASAGAIVGALLAEAVSAELLSRSLGVVAIGAAVAGGRRSGMRNLPHALFSEEPAGEWPGTLSGAYRLDDGSMVPYRARRLPLGLGAMGGAGLVSGLAGVGGGFIKTPAMSEIMHVPVKVAAATSTFTVGITAATSLIVFGSQGRIDAAAGAAVVVGGLGGGWAGAAVQGRIPPSKVRGALSVALVVIGLTLVVTA